jgi:Lon protease-like protein
MPAPTQTRYTISVNPNSLPLFPLGTVLFPGGLLPLRIFEPRYLELIRDSARLGTGFGVCLILEGSEVGEPALPAALGCEARIVDFSTTDDGLLGIVVQGERRFHVARTKVRDNGLIVAEVDWLAESPPVRIRPEHQLLSILLGRILERAEAPFEKAELEALLQEYDPHMRLQRLVEHLPEFQQC